MLCNFCGKPTNMTVTDNSDNPFNCCKECRNKANEKKEKLHTSMIWKEKQTSEQENF